MACSKVSSHCYSISKQGVVVKGCIADLGFVCVMNKRKVKTCNAVDTSPLIGVTIATEVLDFDPCFALCWYAAHFAP